MRRSGSSVLVQVSVLVTYLGMVVVNALANILPINGVNTGQISNSYPNLFAPVALTFTIWGLIYLLLACYSVYQLGFFQKGSTRAKTELLNRVGTLFSVSSVANILWIFSWHYRQIPLSMLLMVVILLCLIVITKLIRQERLGSNDKIFLRLPFSVYFGWITVATIANATTMLVSLKWSGFGISDQVWTVLILFVGLLIGVLTILKHRDVPYGLVFIWAYCGIGIKHVGQDGFAFQYPPIVYTVVVCLVALIVTVITANYRNIKDSS